MFVDLDWPLNASSLLSASAELLVFVCHAPSPERRAFEGCIVRTRIAKVFHILYETMLRIVYEQKLSNMEVHKQKCTYLMMKADEQLSWRLVASTSSLVIVQTRLVRLQRVAVSNSAHIQYTPCRARDAADAEVWVNVMFRKFNWLFSPSTVRFITFNSENPCHRALLLHAPHHK